MRACLRLCSGFGWAGGLVAVLLAAAAVALAAAAAAAPGAETSALTPSAPSPPSSVTDEEHVAKGEVQFDNQWVPIDDLSKDCQAARDQLTGLNSQVDAMRGPLAKLQYQLRKIKTQSELEERPIRADLAQAKAKQREYQKALNAKAPTPPQLTPMPPQPPQPPQINYGYHIVGKETPIEEWRRKSAAIKAKNDQLMQKYQQELEQHKNTQNEAKQGLPAVLAKIKQDEDQLQKIADDCQAKEAPILENHKGLADEMAALVRQTTVLESRVKAMEAAIGAAPESVRFKHDLIEWEGVFYPLADLEKLYTETQAEIVRVNQQMKAEAEAAGRPLPANWRHPQQDRMDALKVLVDRAKKGQAPK